MDCLNIFYPQVVTLHVLYYKDLHSQVLLLPLPVSL